MSTWNAIPEQSVGLRERKKARTRAAIQDAALRLYLKQGYDATTVEQIADAAEVLTAGDLYPDSVERLLQALAFNDQALTARSPHRQRSLFDQGVAALQEARERMGQGLVFLLGEGNLAF